MKAKLRLKDLYLPKGWDDGCDARALESFSSRAWTLQEMKDEIIRFHRYELPKIRKICCGGTV
jgi:hypothetical protein